MIRRSYNMKTISILVCCAVIIFSFSHRGTERAITTHKSTISSSSAADTLDFKKDIQPILQKNCSPCHFEGGKMYEKLPFDKGETIANHEAGAMKRFSEKKEASLIKQFIDQRKPD